MKIIVVALVIMLYGCAATHLPEKNNVSLIEGRVAISGSTNLPSRTVDVDDPVEAKEIRALIQRIRASPFRKPMPSFDLKRIEVLKIRLDQEELTMAIGRLVDQDKTHGDRFYAGSEKHHEKLWKLAVEHLKREAQ